MAGPGAGQIPSSLSVGTAIATNGDYLKIGSWPVAYAYNGDETLNYEQITAPDSDGGGVYRKTYTYTAGKVSAISGWVKQ